MIRPAPWISRLRENREEKRRNILVKVIILIGLISVTVLAFVHESVLDATTVPGEIWPHETLTAPFDFAIFKDPDTLEAEKRRVRIATEPVFQVGQNAQMRMRGQYESLLAQLDEVFEAYRQWKTIDSQNIGVDGSRADDTSNQSAGDALADSIRYHQLVDRAQLRLSEDEWDLLAQDYVSRIPGFPGAERENVGGSPLYEDIFQRVFGRASELNSIGVISVPLDSVFADQIRVRDLDASTYSMVQKEGMFGLNEAFDIIQTSVEQALGPNVGLIPTRFAQAIFVPSLEYDHGATVRRQLEAERHVSPTRGRVVAGEEIVAEGQLVTPEIKLSLVSLERELQRRTGAQIQWGLIAGQGLLAIIAFAIFFLYLFIARRKAFDDNAMVLLIALVFAGIVGLFALAIRADPNYMYAVPVVVASVLLTVVFDSRIGLVGTLTLALIGGLIFGHNLQYPVAVLFGGTLAIFSVRNVRNRQQIVVSAGATFAGYAVALVASWLTIQGPVDQMWSHVGMAGVSAVLVLLTYPLLWIFENSFGVTTDLRLLELSDTNRPVLKQLALQAPGTFNHSLQVASLAQAAAESIGANGLLTQIGALYHDVGKMTNPQFFIENQASRSNPHSELPPEESAKIIINHVKAGIDIGQQAGLPKSIVDFIARHHGTSRTEYFYRVAQSAASAANEQLDERDFRYPGPIPDTKEASILMLTDGVEAACRSLDKPTSEELETVLDAIFAARVDDGQLDDSPLTFKELRQVRDSLFTHLSGIYHTRVKYPSPA